MTLPSERGMTKLMLHQQDSLPGLLAFEWLDMDPQSIEGRFEVKKHHLAPTGFLHAATVVALADTAAGFGCLNCLPDGATGFTTAELKTNFLGTCRDGGVRCRARLIHGGRTTQVWDAEIWREADAKTIALFRCTQILLYPQKIEESTAASAPEAAGTAIAKFTASSAR